MRVKQSSRIALLDMHILPRLNASHQTTSATVVRLSNFEGHATANIVFLIGFMHCAIQAMWGCGTPVRVQLEAMEKLRKSLPEVKKNLVMLSDE